MVLVAGSSFAQDYLSLSPTKFSLQPGQTQDVELMINAGATMSYNAVQVQIALPEGTRPVALNAADIEAWKEIGMDIEPVYAEVTMPSFPAALKYQDKFQVATNIFEKGQDIYKDDNNGKVYERTTTKPELGIVLFTVKAAYFPFVNNKEESLIKFRIEATDRCYTGEETLDLTYAVLNTKENIGYSPADKIGAAVMNYSIEYKLDDNCEYGTLCWPVALDFTANDFEAGIAALGSSTISTTKVTKVPAATPVVIKGEKGKTYNLSTTREESLDDVSSNVLEGTVDAPLTVSGDNIYALANLSNGPGFYRVKSGVEIPQYKAYYTATGASVDAFIFEEYTGINKVVADDANAEVYTISGMKVDKANKKGVYIVNGKKVVVK